MFLFVSVLTLFNYLIYFDDIMTSTMNRILSAVVIALLAVNNGELTESSSSPWWRN